ncbi:hypothetical protein FVF61_11150 [Formosa maritima]|uniref:Uncharacterized protein n=2 Tax=Formosa maritima TaxID=2592046 RepID=A0A5D0G4K3_9FLAO|nr:hypothetical protein FVF61_11150 [Formosa maritima]
METGKTGKYFKYAIGEIILVVIGILIALSINNWNTIRLEKNEEVKLLTDMRSEFKKNLKLLSEYDIVRIDTVLNNQDYLINYNDLNKTNNLSIAFQKAFKHPTWNPSLMILDDLKNSGKLSKISNNHLKQSLYNWYSFYTDYLEDIKVSEISYQNLLSYTLNNGIYFDLMTSINSGNLSKHKQLVELLLKDKIFMSFLINYNQVVLIRKKEYLDAQNIIKEIIKESNN